MRLFVYPYNSNSESAKLLAEAIGAKRIRLSNSEYEYRPDDLIINWGNSHCPYPSLNRAEVLQNTVNKLCCFRKLRGKGFDAIPDYWTDPNDIPASAFPIFCRTEVNGHDGSGIVVAMCRSDLVPAKLYTRMLAGTEYRVTVFRGEVTDIQTKLPRNGVEVKDELVRTYANGWGFQRRAITGDIEDIIIALARDALRELDLDFAGFDIIYNPMQQRAYLLEANSAMGLEGGALDRFADAVLAYAETLRPPPLEIPLLPPMVPPAPQVNLDDYTAQVIAEAVAQKDWAMVIKVAAMQLPTPNQN